MPKSRADAQPWRVTVRRIIRAEMTKFGVDYRTLSARLQAIGVDQTAENLRNKITRGILGADLFLQIMLVLDVRKLAMDEIKDIHDHQ